VVPDCQALHILEYEIGSFQLIDDADKFPNKTVPRVVQRTVPDQREALARSTSKNDIDAATTDPCALPDFFACQADNRPGQDGAAGEIECVDGAMDRVDFNGGHEVEACLLEAQAKTASTRE
jgi:hypothetical protein